MRQAAFILYSNISNTLSMTFYFGRSVPRDIARTKLPITGKTDTMYNLLFACFSVGHCVDCFV